MELSFNSDQILMFFFINRELGTLVLTFFEY